jgi:methanogenic corrinoid protein MtbC1
MNEIKHIKNHELAQEILNKIYENIPGLEKKYNEEQKFHAFQDVLYHLDHISVAISLEEAKLFSQYFAWAREVLETRGIPITHLSITIESIKEVLSRELPTKIHDFLNEMFELSLRELKKPLNPDQPYYDEKTTQGKNARNFLKIILEGERKKAIGMINDLISNGTSIKTIYLEIFQPVQMEIGRLWQRNKISVAQEHFATGVTQMIISQLYPEIFNTKKNGKIVVATCVGDELHELGIRMVSDFLELSGFDTYYLGANTPATSIVKSIIERKADLLAISVTMMTHLDAIKKTIELVRSSAVANVKILVGGYSFNLIPNLWKKIGADGSAKDADSAIDVAKELCLLDQN